MVVGFIEHEDGKFFEAHECGVAAAQFLDIGVLITAYSKIDMSNVDLIYKASIYVHTGDSPGDEAFYIVDALSGPMLKGEEDSRRIRWKINAAGEWIPWVCMRVLAEPRLFKYKIVGSEARYSIIPATEPKNFVELQIAVEAVLRELGL